MHLIFSGAWKLGLGDFFFFFFFLSYIGEGDRVKFFPIQNCHLTRWAKIFVFVLFVCLLLFFFLTSMPPGY